eukprot:TRINITY_DN13651_c0_g1_i1.p1 TRINITY_DN13651_c0_g1~~TRINITY_DN13651_c0_g1_i1.p1  ORF type:complete len:508 (+),score=149.29 TRINITY_DN13651_c0_g1_i1:105-1526(+)
MSFSLFQRTLASALGEEPFHKDTDALAVDLKLTATDELETAMQQIEKALEGRKKPRSDDRVQQQLQHIEDCLSQPGTVPWSMDHLELYQAYLRRVEPPPELRERHSDLSSRVAGMLHTHPLAREKRSGDRPHSPAHHSRGDEMSIIRVPARRRRQMCVILALNFFTGPAFFILLTILAWLYVPLGDYLVPLYLLFIMVDNFLRPMPAPKRIVKWWRNSVVFELARDYFPIRHVKARAETSYDPEANYLFGFHPHGVMSVGALIMTTAASGIDKLIPGISISVQTLSVNFWLPVFRDHIIALGTGDASRGTLMRALKGPGRSALLVTGGAKESMYAHPYHSIVVIKKRFGFIKIALRAGAQLVPMWSFGENNLYENLATNEGVRKWQRRIQKMISFAPVLVAGRGVFTYGGGLIPHRRPVTVVIGAPLRVEKVAEPTDEQVQELHGRYMQALRDLFELYRDIYDPKARDIEFID